MFLALSPSKNQEACLVNNCYPDLLSNIFKDLVFKIYLYQESVVFSVFMFIFFTNFEIHNINMLPFVGSCWT